LKVFVLVAISHKKPRVNFLLSKIFSPPKIVIIFQPTVAEAGSIIARSDKRHFSSEKNWQKL
jgi:hypothetical protein